MLKAHLPRSAAWNTWTELRGPNQQCDLLCALALCRIFPSQLRSHLQYWFRGSDGLSMWHRLPSNRSQHILKPLAGLAPTEITEIRLQEHFEPACLCGLHPRMFCKGHVLCKLWGWKRASSSISVNKAGSLGGYCAVKAALFYACWLLGGAREPSQNKHFCLKLRSKTNWQRKALPTRRTFRINIHVYPSNPLILIHIWSLRR